MQTLTEYLFHRMLMKSSGLTEKRFSENTQGKTAMLSCLMGNFFLIPFLYRTLSSLLAWWTRHSFLGVGEPDSNLSVQFRVVICTETLLENAVSTVPLTLCLF